MKTFEQIQDLVNKKSVNLWASLLLDLQQPINKNEGIAKNHISQQNPKQNAWDWDIQEESTLYKSLVSNQSECPFYNQQLDFAEQAKSMSMFLGQNGESKKGNLPYGQFGEKHTPIGLYKPGKLDDSTGPYFSKSKEHIDEILKERKLKKRIKKNSNVPKFLVRVYLKHFSATNRNKQSKVLEYHKKAKNALSGRRSYNYKIADIMTLLRQEKTENKNISLNNRKVMAQILRNEGTKQILDNSYIKGNTISYMIASKIYGLRCKSVELIERVKMF